jgi:hypothetical protein
MTITMSILKYASYLLGFFILNFYGTVAYSQKADTVNIADLLKGITQTPKPRNYLNVDQLDRTAAYIKKEFEKYADTVFYQTYTVGERIYRNVIAVNNPAETRTYVIGAHYDVCGVQEGADDNASGIAGLLEFARLMDTIKTEHRLEMVAYTLEEPPYFRTENMGSAVHAKSLAERGLKPEGMIALEMIGYFSDEKKSQEYPLGILGLFYGRKGNYITVVNKMNRGKFGKSVLRGMKRGNPKSSSIDVKSFQAPKNLPGIDFSDHQNYWNLGVSSCMITDTAFYRNKNYHEKSDTLSTLDISRMAEVIDALFYSFKKMDQQ